MRRRTKLLVLYTLLLSCRAFAQDTSTLKNVDLSQVSGHTLQKLNTQYAAMGNQVSRQSGKLLSACLQKEQSLEKKVSQTDTNKAKQVFTGVQQQYQQLQSKMQSLSASSVTEKFPLKQYIPRLDSLQTTLAFLSQKGANIPAGKLQQLQQLSGSVQLLEAKLQMAGQIQNFVQQREQQLTSALPTVNVSGMTQQAYYYQQQIGQYKAALNDPKKMEEALLSTVSRLPVFQHYMQQNSYLAMLYPTPQGAGTPVALAGLQSRAQVLTAVRAKIPAQTEGGDPSQFLQGQLQQAQSQLGALKDKLSGLGINTGGSNSMIMPAYTPNTQHGKTFFKRIEIGLTFQNNPGTTLLPQMTIFGLTAGYKFSDRVTAGLGVVYQLGLGNGLTDLQLSNQGAGLRSFVDIKAKGSIWVTGGFEYNYMQQFSSLHTLYDINLWQKSALLGLTKKIKIGKTQNSLSLLYDFLAASQVPKGQSIVFRIGYTF
ncbi:hypothetical protein [Dinghuibacter silviterrae]|uniref:Outer membrane protein with beta-barrel domain n=1 Tax=Dinghuibacter silviterrae TaxID=1539049 RepID=A0A4R8DJI4_9BACT|nr:hypothetical protein [Dinghuibacter silviterrae]TDW97474.1 hypothetical protein EDB95_5324 [Dinghuibacter silviterrae]